MNENTTITLSLISHTNVGKTTLARTLLRRDIGQVLDQPHVTDTSEAFPMIQTPQGDLLRLWDTPGFGDTARLLRRLEQSANPLGWFLSQVWDRFADRPLWCSQQAVRNIREEADLVLYLVNAAEDPAQARYVEMEMKILSWMGVPVITLLNQTGPPREPAAERADQDRWQTHLQAFPVVKQTLSLDAFARCWVQEGILLQEVEPLLPAAKQPAYQRLTASWRQQNMAVFHQSMHRLAVQLAEACADRETVADPSLTDHIRQVLASLLPASKQQLSPHETAMALLAERLDKRIREAMDHLIQLHGLEGRAAAEIFQRLRDHYATSRPLHQGVSAVLGGFVSGVLGGLVADLAAGGLTFGGGALVGGLLGAAGAGVAAKGYNILRGDTASTVRWSPPFIQGLIRSALLRYLAVAHYGRGRGHYKQSEYPAFWQTAVAESVSRREAQIQKLCERAKSPADAPKLVPDMQAQLASCAGELLTRFYPEAAQQWAVSSQQSAVS